MTKTERRAYFRAYFRKYNHTPKRVEYERQRTARRMEDPDYRLKHKQWKRRWRATPRGRKLTNESARKFDPVKEKCRRATRRAISSGKIKRMPCAVCGNPKSQSHHDDYTKPLEVTFLCALHHKRHHKRKDK